MRKPVFVPCGKCENGFLYYQDGYRKITKCQCLSDFQKLSYAYAMYKKANLPESVFSYKIDSYIGPDNNGNIPKLKKIVKDFKKTFYNKFLYFYGNSGTQKTTLTFWLARELLKQKISVYYSFMSNLIEDLTQNSFEEKDLLKKYDVDCLIIDRAFDKEQNNIAKSRYQIPYLDNFLRNRIEVQEKCIIFISNASIDQISENKMNDDIEDLIRRKVLPYKTDLHFQDHYTLKDDFDFMDIWSK